MRKRGSTIVGDQLVKWMTEHGPMHAPGICSATGRDYSATVPILTNLKATGRIVIVGTAREWGFKDVKTSAPVYDVPREVARAPTPPAADSRGSGVIAGRIEIGRGYHWGSWRLA